MRAASDVTRFDPDEILGPMGPREAAGFLGMAYGTFKEIAPTLPQHTVTPHRFVYLRRELLAWLAER